MAKKRIIKELMGNTKVLILPITNKFELMIEKQDSDEVFFSIFSPGGDNQFDLTPYLDLNVDMSDSEVKDIIIDYLITHVIFDGKVNPITPKEQIKQPNRLKYYYLMEEIDEVWINRYAMETGDTEFNNLDPFVYEYIDDIMTELETSSFPINARKKWDDEEKLKRIKETIIKQIKEYKDNQNK